MKEEMIKLLEDKVSVNEFVYYLKQLKGQGIEKQIVYNTLVEIRSSLQNDEEKEDIILEVMDIVLGFCTPEKTVWD